MFCGYHGGRDDAPGRYGKDVYARGHGAPKSVSNMQKRWVKSTANMVLEDFIEVVQRERREFVARSLSSITSEKRQ